MLSRFHLSKTSFWIPALLILLEVAVWAEVDLYAPGFPAMRDHFSTTDMMIQLTLASNFLGFFIASIFYGPLSDSYGRRVVMLWGTFIFVLGSIMCLRCETINLFVLGRFIQGIGVAAPAVVAITIIIDLFEGNLQAKIISIMNSIICLMMAAAPMTGVYITCEYGWRMNFVVILFFAVLGFLAVLFFIPESIAKKNKDFSLKKLMGDYSRVLGNKDFVKMSLSVCISVIPYWMFVALIPLLFMEVKGIPIKTYGYYQGAVVGTFAILSLVFPLVLDRLDKYKWTLGSLYLMSLTGPMMIVGSYFYDDSPVLLTLTMCFFAASLMYPVNLFFIQSLNMFDDLKGAASSMLMGVRMLTTAIGVAISGYIYDQTYHANSLFMGFLLLLSIPVMIQLTHTVIKEKADDENKATA